MKRSYGCLALACLFFFAIAVVRSALAEDASVSEPETPITSGQPSWIKVEPVSSISFRTYYLSSERPSDSYTLYNSDGDTIDEPVTTFTEIEGNADIKSRFFFYYKAQLKNEDTFDIKKAYAKYRNETISLEAGKDSIWMGHGYHGSLLLSNNAEPFPLIKFQTERTLHVPYIGGFDYMIFHGWPEDFKILGQRLSYKPVDILEFGANQTVIYNRDYDLWEFPKVLSAEEENISNSKWDNDQRASLDIALYMPFLEKFTPFKTGKIYAEYGGEDLYAAWQKEDKACISEGRCPKTKWYLPFDFLQTGFLYGLYLTTDQTELRVEYSKNYINTPLIYDLPEYFGRGSYEQRLRGAWYSKISFLNDGTFMGHHMGSQADDLFVEFTTKLESTSFQVFYDKERHALATFPDSPETLTQVGLMVIYSFDRYTIFASLTENIYKNIDSNPEPLIFDINAGTTAKEHVIGCGVRISL